ncbi:MAG: hypothetical protein ACRD29_19630 [Acidimicrobiales bacterium]
MARLHGRDVDVGVLVTRREFLDTTGGRFAGALLYDTLVARAGEWPEDDPRPFVGVGAEVLESIRCREAQAIGMLDRWNWTGASFMAMRRLYLRYAEIWDTYLRERPPDVVVFHGEPHRGFDWVLYALCQERGIPTGIISYTQLESRLIITGSIEELPGSASRLGEMRATEPDEVRAPSSYYVDHVITRQRDVDSLRRRLSIRHALMSMGAMRKLREVFQPYPMVFPNVVPDSPTSFAERKLENLRMRRRIHRSLRIYEAAARPPDLDAPYVYYPIHLQPEATTLPMGGVMSDQLNNIRLLAAALPERWTVVAKEHPQMLKFTKEWPRARGALFYEELCSIPNVRVAPVEFSSRRLIAHARVVATTTGTAGWEALLGGKFVLFFGFPWYARCPGAVSVRSSDECRAAFASVADNGFENDKRLVQAFVDEFTASHTFLGIWQDAAEGHSSYDRDTLLAGTAGAIRRWAMGATASVLHPQGRPTPR